MIDCGEGTWGSLVRNLGEAGARDTVSCSMAVRPPLLSGCNIIIRENKQSLPHSISPPQVRGLQLVWISHKHADHALGIGEILSHRPPPPFPPLLLVGPHEVGSWLEVTKALHTSWHVRFCHCRLVQGYLFQCDVSSVDNGRLPISSFNL